MLALLVSLMLAAGGQPPAAPIATAPSDERALVKAVLDERARAVEARDIERVARSYVQSDALVVFRPGAAYRGWQAYRAYWERALPGVPDGFRITWHDDIAVHASGDTIVASLTWDTEGGGSKPQQGRITVVLERVGDRHVIVHEHLSGI
jgi:ketosteroid isomerase-like protein